MKLQRFISTAMLLMAPGTSVAAVAQHHAHKAHVATDHRASVKAGEINLGISSGPDTEQWGTIFGVRGVRNVSRATLTPVLPAASTATGAAVIVAPGGAFKYLSINNEGYDVAHWLAAHGIAAFVLKYRTEPTPRNAKDFDAMMMEAAKAMTDPANLPQAAPTLPKASFEDGQAALKLVRSQAKTWGVDPQRIGFLGFSAGAVLTMGMGLAPETADRPDFIVPIYGSPEAVAVPADAPPIFFALALDDPIVARGQLGLLNSWRAAKRPVEAHFYETGGHGFGMNAKTAAAGMWAEEMLAWMEDRGLLKMQAK
ncbi:hypothetical protein TomTYG75_27900 [Sphingobium sp. TomTYG75]